MEGEKDNDEEEGGNMNVRCEKMRRIMQQSEVRTDIESNRPAHFN